MRSGRYGGGQAVGERQNRPFQLSFNSSLKVDFQGSRVTSDGGLVLVRELAERLGLSELMDRHLSDSRRGQHNPSSFALLSAEVVVNPLWGLVSSHDPPPASPCSATSPTPPPA